MKRATASLFLVLAMGMAGFSAERNTEFESDIIKVAIVASDVQATVDFYTNVIGMVKVREFDVDSVTSVQFGLSNGVPFHVTALKLNDSPQATELKITGFKNKPEHQPSGFIQDKIGVQYLTIYVTSMNPLIERIKANGVKFLGRTPAPAGEGYWFTLIQDPNGVFIELIGKE
jgi:predicted enzyme related to lactoylglutathione lyase